MSHQTHIPDEFKPAIGAKGSLSESFWAADQGPNHNEITEDHAFNYGMKDGAGAIGQIGRINENDDARDIGSDGKSKKEKERRLQDIINKVLQDLYDNMDTWSADDFKDFNKAVADKYREKMRATYDAGDFALYATYSDDLNEFLEKSDAIWDDPNITEEEKKEANEELFKEQDTDVLYEAYDKGVTEEKPTVEELVNRDSELADSATTKVDSDMPMSQFNGIGLG